MLTNKVQNVRICSNSLAQINMTIILFVLFCQCQSKTTNTIQYSVLSMSEIDMTSSASDYQWHLMAPKNSLNNNVEKQGKYTLEKIKQTKIPMSSWELYINNFY